MCHPVPGKDPSSCGFVLVSPALALTNESHFTSVKWKLKCTYGTFFLRVIIVKAKGDYMQRTQCEQLSQGYHSEQVVPASVVGRVLLCSGCHSYVHLDQLALRRVAF